MERCVGKPNLTARRASQVPGTAPAHCGRSAPRGVLLIAGFSLAPFRLKVGLVECVGLGGQYILYVVIKLGILGNRSHGAIAVHVHNRRRTKVQD